MTEQVITQHETKLNLDEDARRALAQVYRLLLSLAEKEESETTTAETHSEEESEA